MSSAKDDGALELAPEVSTKQKKTIDRRVCYHTRRRTCRSLSTKTCFFCFGLLFGLFLCLVAFGVLQIDEETTATTERRARARRPHIHTTTTTTEDTPTQVVDDVITTRSSDDVIVEVTQWSRNESEVVEDFLTTTTDQNLLSTEEKECLSEEFLCPNESRVLCLSKDSLCDGKVDCPSGGQDENDCPLIARTLTKTLTTTEVSRRGPLLTTTPDTPDTPTPTPLTTPSMAMGVTTE